MTFKGYFPDPHVQKCFSFFFFYAVVRVGILDLSLEDHDYEVMKGDSCIKTHQVEVSVLGCAVFGRHLLYMTLFDKFIRWIYDVFLPTQSFIHLQQLIHLLLMMHTQTLQVF